MTFGFDLSSDDPVTVGLRASARQLLGVAAFSGVVNLLTLSGSLYMLQVYDRVIPSRNVATLVGLFLIALYVFHPTIGVAATLGAASIIAVTFATERRVRGPSRASMETIAHRQILADATRQNADVIRALGMTGRFTERWLRGNDRFLEISVRAMDAHANLASGAKVLRYVLQSSMLGIGAYLVVIEQASGGIMIASSIMMGRALAPIEVALSTWKQLVAARQGIARLREILKTTAAPPVPPVVLPRPQRELSVQDL